MRFNICSGILVATLKYDFLDIYKNFFFYKSKLIFFLRCIKLGDILAFFAVHGKTFFPVFSHLFYIFTLRFQSEGLFPHSFLAFMLRNVFFNLRLDEYSTIMFSSSCFIFLFNFLVTWNKLLYSVKCDSNLVL